MEKGFQVPGIMKTFVVILAPFLLCSGVLSLQYTDCGSTKGKVSGVTVSGCENTPVCSLKRGSSASVTLNFQSLTDTKTVKAVVHGVISGVPLPFPLPQSDGCTNCGLTCPLKNGQSNSYSTTINVRNSYPAVNVDVKFELQDDNGEDLVCVLIPSKVE